MFVRFRASARRLQVSLIETGRVGGKVRQEHVASLGAIRHSPTVADRVDYWRRLHERLGQLSNRIDSAAQGKLLGEVHARIPMVTIEEIRALQLENTEADERFWSDLHDMHQATAEDHKQLLASIQQAIATADAEAKVAEAKAGTAKERARRVRDGEDVPGGLVKQLTREDFHRIMRDAGWTTQDIDHAGIVHQLSQLGGFDEYLAEVHKRHRRTEFAAARAILRRRLARPV